MGLLVIAELTALNRHATTFLFVLPILMLILIHPRVLNGIFSFIMPLLPRLSNDAVEEEENSVIFNWSYPEPHTLFREEHLAKMVFKKK